MKYAVIGSRKPGKKSVERVIKYLDSLIDIELIVTGGAYGADTAGMNYAFEHGIPLTVYAPNATHNSTLCDYLRRNYDKANIVNTGRGYLERNTKVVSDSDIVICTDYGNGTIDSMEKALRQNKPVLVFGEYIRGKYHKRTPNGVTFMKDSD